jgi:hypothetical protein
MIFAKCPRLYGEANVLKGALAVETYRDVILDQWALYDRSRRIIDDSGYFRGVPHYSSILGNPVTNYDPLRVSDCMPDQDFFWLGPFHLHFGHFLVCTLARAWAIAVHAQPGTPIVYVGGVSPKRLFAIEFIRECMESFGITENRLIHASGPVRFPRITVAAPAFTENHSVHPVYFKTLRLIADRLGVSSTTGSERDLPVYISKEKVSSGVRTIVNESDMTRILQDHGIEVAFPETLSFRDQLRFWAHQRIMFGFASSAFHMSAFFGNRRLCTISQDASVGSNQVLLDLIARNESLYLYPPDGFKRLGKTEHFGDSIAIKDPARMAKDIVRVAEGYGQSRTIQPQRLAPEPRTLCQTASIDDPFGTNVTQLGVATQSSTYHIDEGWSRTASGAISGQLTGYYQSHTEIELQPWWQVELPEVIALYEVRVFNRCDNPAAQSRLDRLRILLSLDGTVWETVVEREAEGSIGGLRGEPYRWLAPSRTTTRFVRLQIPSTTYLHLDQVEIFGEPEEIIWPGQQETSRRPLASCITYQQQNS